MKVAAAVYTADFLSDYYRHIACLGPGQCGELINGDKLVPISRTTRLLGI